MKQWKVYISGIEHGEIFMEQGKLFHSLLNVFSGKLEEKQQLTQESAKRLAQLLPIHWEKLPKQIETYEKALENAPQLAVMPEGEEYQRAGENMYIQRKVKFPKNLLTANGKIVGIVVPARERVGILIDPEWENLTVLAQWKKEYSGEKLFPVEYKGEFFVQTRDGERLATDVFLPKGKEGTVPVVLVRTPYKKENASSQYYRFVQRGYGVVIQDVRGREGSSGQWLPMCFEIEDGDDTLNWIAAQPWSNQKIGMIGGSYLGYVQWAAAASGNPYLQAIISVVCAGSPFVDLPRRGGCFNSGMMAWSFYMAQRTGDPGRMEREDWDQVLDIRPIEDIPKKALGYDIPFIKTWLEHQDYDDFWKRSNWAEKGLKSPVPALIQSGWFDDNGMGTTEALELTKDYPAGLRKVILGPWPHSGNAHYDLNGLALGDKALRFDLDLLYFKWFDHFLKGKENGVEQGTAVEYYTVEENCWKTAENWPVPRAKETTFYLTSQGGANTSGGNGALVMEPPKGPGQDTLVYHPENPAVCLIDLSENEIEMPGDYAQEEKRQDYLCYTSKPLEKDMVATGEFLAELYVSSDAVDTDFVVRITDVDEKGRSMKLADGVLCARYREGFEQGKMMEPGKIYKLDIRSTKLSHLFRKGHCIRFTVTSSAKNFIFPNSNTEDGYNSTTVQPARNTLYHGGCHCSKVTAFIEG